MMQNTWFDPFFIFENLSEEDRLIQKNVKDFSTSILKPKSVIIFDKKEFTKNKKKFTKKKNKSIQFIR